MIKTINYKGQEISFEITDPNDYLQKFWLRGTFYELGMLQFIEDRWNERAKTEELTFVDVGACIGNHTIFFAKVMGAYVYAFEPVPANMNLLMHNATINKVISNVMPVELGAGSSGCHVPFKYDSSGNSGMGKVASDGEAVVGIIPVDDVISHSHEVDILKIDVEGYNIPVLEGARQTIERNHPEIYIECQTPAELQEVEGLLLPMGYKRWPAHFNATPTYFFYY
jgi:FkbM family methyltransferase